MSSGATTADPPRAPRRGPGVAVEVLLTIGAALLVAWLVQALLVKPFRIPSGSMENTLRCGERVLVNRVSYHLHKPAQFDVVVFHPPASVDAHGNVDANNFSTVGGVPGEQLKGDRLRPANVDFVKRIIGMPGDRVQITDQRAIVNGKPLKEPFLHPLPAAGAGIGVQASYGPITVPKGQYFMMGDNRADSSDSRVFGTVPRSFFVGRTFMSYWPPSRFGGLPSKDPGGEAARADDPNCEESTPFVGGSDHG